MSSYAKQAALQCSTGRIARMFVKHQDIMMTEFLMLAFRGRLAGCYWSADVQR